MKKNLLTIVTAIFLVCLVIVFCIMGNQHNTIQAYSKQLEVLKADKVKLSNQMAYHKNMLEFTAPTEYGLSKMTVDDLVLLSKVVQLASGDSYYRKTQQYMTKVILNRIVSPDFPDTVSEVVYQEDQFDVIGDIDTCELERDTVLNVFEVLSGDAAIDLPGYVTYFYADHVKEDWTNTLTVYMTYEGTVYSYVGGSNLQ